MSLRGTLRSLSWCVREPLKLLDGWGTAWLQREAVARSVPVWEDRLNEFEAENDGLEPDTKTVTLRAEDPIWHRNPDGSLQPKTLTDTDGGEWTVGPASHEPPYLSWGVDGATTDSPAASAPIPPSEAAGAGGEVGVPPPTSPSSKETPDAFEIAEWVADAARFIGGLPEDVARRVAASVSLRLLDANPK